MSLPTPYIGHLTEEDYEHVYEPAEDSFILLDALEADAIPLRAARPSLCVEIGSGSGVVSTFLMQLLGPNQSLIIATDINPLACQATQKTSHANNVTVDLVQCNLLKPLLPRVDRGVDVLVFNPPYVPTDLAEFEQTQASASLGGAWAGGSEGMGTTTTVIELLSDLLSPQGRFYLVAVEQNRPQDIVARLQRQGLRSEVK
ncbi:S-adenosylmethionine-dependent methyltransferase [Saitozyma podzolica]|uniref:S-adenosylmethionine-dependent methyltransferase n=1 Tax=Saitozyma podzolica TaxID=1890683 RepID=A0A427YET3_9TREE|nr:S-adenosylmethionine-dependent methyltransferase [Saitozyma podzolica]